MIALGNVVVRDTVGHSATVAGVDLELTEFERALLYRLAQVPGECVPRAALYETLYGTDPLPRTSNVIEVIVSRLRRKLSDRRASVEIVTRRARGYMLRAIEAVPTP